MAKFPFAVKHNGVLYEAGKEVPIGKEAKKENEQNDKTVAQIREELKALGVTKFESNKKADLIKQLEQVKAEKEKEIANDENTEDEENELDPQEENEEDEEESSLLDEIINE